MRLIKSSACLAAALQASFAWAQVGVPAQPGAPKATQTQAKAATASPDVPDATYRSPFADYRKFAADEPPRNWRRANDEVRDAGGHIGLMKGAEAKGTDHGGHGAKPREAGK